MSIYILFIFWKDDVFSEDFTIEAVFYHHRSTGIHTIVVSGMLTLCILPILNLYTLYQLIIAKVEMIYFSAVLITK